MSWLTTLNGLLWLLHVLSAMFLLLYGLNCYLMIFLQRRAKNRILRQDAEVWQAWHRHPQALPHVTVQLPIYNERYVVQRLVEAVVCLDYPKERLEIQILDDSADETTAIAAELVAHYRQAGYNIALLHRTHRQGYKAGALKEGLAVATGTYIAIFDADFVPNPDFLGLTLPFFQDPTIAMVQTRWGHINWDYSGLTRVQALGIDGHFWVEQSARCWSGLLMNFNGSGGIWRRQAIEEAGGWQADTLTEDLDLSYRVQLHGWRMKFLPQVICPAEVPVQMSGIKSQQHRWAKGSIQTAKKLLPRVMRSDLPLFSKCQAVLHLTNYMVHPCILLAALASPLLLRFDALLPPQQPGIVAGLCGLAMFGPSSLYVYAQSQLYPDWKRRLRTFPFLLMFGTGIALNNTKAILEAMCNVHGAFVRTPKFRIEHASDTWVGKRYRVAFPWLSLVEVLLACYGAYGIVLALQRGTYLVPPFLVLSTMGFAAVAGASLWEVWQKHRHRRPAPASHASPGVPDQPAPVCVQGPVKTSRVTNVCE